MHGMGSHNSHSSWDGGASGWLSPSEWMLDEPTQFVQSPSPAMAPAASTSYAGVHHMHAGSHPPTHAGTHHGHRSSSSSSSTGASPKPPSSTRTRSGSSASYKDAMRSMTYKFPAASSPAAYASPAAQRASSIGTDSSEGKSKGAREQDKMRDRRRSRLAELNALLPPPYRQDSHQPDMRAIDGAIDYLRVVQTTVEELRREVGALGARCRSAQAANEQLAYEKGAMAGTIAQMQAQAMSRGGNLKG